MNKLFILGLVVLALVITPTVLATRETSCNNDWTITTTEEACWWYCPTNHGGNSCTGYVTGYYIVGGMMYYQCQCYWVGA